MGLRVPRRRTILKWLFCFVTGLSTGILAFFIGLGVSNLYTLRWNWIVSLLEHGRRDVTANTFAVYSGFNMCLVLVGALVVYGVPESAGSGIPDLMAYMNGVDVAGKKFLRVRTFVAKVLSSVMAVSGALCVGKEGPMLHIGSCMAHKLGQWAQLHNDGAETFTRRLKVGDEVERSLDPFFLDRNVRDLVAVGAAAGVSAAFRAPVGGILFIMELTPRWRPELTTRTFFVTAITALVLQFCILGCRSSSHCPNFTSETISPTISEMRLTPRWEQLPAMLMLGVLGGLVGAVFNTMNQHICRARKGFVKDQRSWLVLEMGLLSLLTSLLSFLLPSMGQCMPCKDATSEHEVGPDRQHCAPGSGSFQSFTYFGCGENEYNDLAVLLFNPQGFQMSALMISPLGDFSLPALALFLAFYFVMAALTYGSLIPAGLYTPSLLMGSTLGRLYAHILVRMGLYHGHVDPGLYSLLGAAAVFAGLLRLTVSMCVVLLEMTGEMTVLPFLMTVMVVAKGVGDRFTDSVFVKQIRLKGLQVVGHQPHISLRRQLVTAGEIMRSPPNFPVLTALSHVTDIQQVLQDCDWEILPVVEDGRRGNDAGSEHGGRSVWSSHSGYAVSVGAACPGSSTHGRARLAAEPIKRSAGSETGSAFRHMPRSAMASGKGSGPRQPRRARFLQPPASPRAGPEVRLSRLETEPVVGPTERSPSSPMALPSSPILFPAAAELRSCSSADLEKFIRGPKSPESPVARTSPQQKDGGAAADSAAARESADSSSPGFAATLTMLRLPDAAMAHACSSSSSSEVVEVHAAPALAPAPALPLSGSPSNGSHSGSRPASPRGGSGLPSPAIACNPAQYRWRSRSATLSGSRSAHDIAKLASPGSPATNKVQLQRRSLGDSWPVQTSASADTEVGEVRPSHLTAKDAWLLLSRQEDWLHRQQDSALMSPFNCSPAPALPPSPPADPQNEPPPLPPPPAAPAANGQMEEVRVETCAESAPPPATVPQQSRGSVDGSWASPDSTRDVASTTAGSSVHPRESRLLLRDDHRARSGSEAGATDSSAPSPSSLLASPFLSVMNELPDSGSQASLGSMNSFGRARREPAAPWHCRSPRDNASTTAGSCVNPRESRLLLRDDHRARSGSEAGATDSTLPSPSSLLASPFLSVMSELPDSGSQASLGSMNSFGRARREPAAPWHGRFIGWVPRSFLEGAVRAASVNWRNRDVCVARLAQEAPLSITSSLPLPKIFQLFNWMDVTILPVLDQQGNLEGIITRQEVVKCQTRLAFEQEVQLGKMRLPRQVTQLVRAVSSVLLPRAPSSRPFGMRQFSLRRRDRRQQSVRDPLLSAPLSTISDV